MRLPLTLFVCDHCERACSIWSGATRPRGWHYLEDDTDLCPDCHDEHARDLSHPEPPTLVNDLLDPDLSDAVVDDEP